MTCSTRRTVSSNAPIAVLAGLLGLGACISISHAQEPTNTLLSEEIQAAIQDAIQQLIQGSAQQPEAMATDVVIKKLASRIPMIGTRIDGSRYRADLVPYSLMQIHDPVRGRSGTSRHDGELWAWGSKGRPIAVAEIWRWNQSGHRWGHALVSTTPGRVTAEIGGQTWSPDGPGLKFHPLNDAPTPSAAQQDRAQQAKDIAKQFAGYEVYRGNRIDLELQPDPIYHYASKGVSGSIFALVHYDNPEALLFVESVEDPVLPNSWRYAVAQVSSHELHIENQGQEVVTIPEATNYVGTPTDPLWVVYVTTGSGLPAHNSGRILTIRDGIPTWVDAPSQEKEARQSPDTAPPENGDESDDKNE